MPIGVEAQVLPGRRPRDLVCVPLAREVGSVRVAVRPERYTEARQEPLYFDMPRKTIITTLLLLSLTVSANPCAAQNQQQLQYSVVYADSEGITHFRDEYLPWQRTQGRGNAPISVTPLLDAQKIGFLTLPRGYRQDWHPAPSKRFTMVLAGVAEIEVGDGERRKFGPGSVVLVTDVQGRGHRTRVLGNRENFVVWVPVP
jgi:hypothetical protein